jgi:crossover junction endodeoxyribonuclease RuvC
MIILGVDPGTLITGYAVIDSSSGKPKVLDYDVIKNPSINSLPLRLKLIYNTLVKVINKFKPDEFAIETAFYSKNVQSTLKLGHARGVSILTAVNKQIPIAEYSPREIKKSVVGIGSASKEQVRYMVCKILGIKSLKGSLDVSDALAVALCHYNKYLNYHTYNQRWEDYVNRNPKRVKFHLPAEGR